MVTRWNVHHPSRPVPVVHVISIVLLDLLWGMVMSVGLEKGVARSIWRQDLNHRVGEKHRPWSARGGATKRMWPRWGGVDELIDSRHGRGSLSGRGVHPVVVHHTYRVCLPREAVSIESAAVDGYWVIAVPHLTHRGQSGTSLARARCLVTSTAFAAYHAVGDDENAHEEHDYWGCDVESKSPGIVVLLQCFGRWFDLGI